MSLLASLAVIGIVGCKKELPVQQTSPVASTTNQGTVLSDGKSTWYLAPGFMKSGTNVTRDGTNWPAGEFKVSLSTNRVSE